MNDERSSANHRARRWKCTNVTQPTDDERVVRYGRQFKRCDLDKQHTSTERKESIAEVKLPVHYQIEDSHYLRLLSECSAQNGRCTILELRLPIWAVDETVAISANDDSNGYIIEDVDSFKSFILDHRHGLSDTWANIVSIRLGTIKVPSACAPIIGQLFLAMFGQLESMESLDNSPLKLALKGVSMYMDSLAIGRHQVTNTEENMAPSPRVVKRHKRSFKRIPIYTTNWSPETSHDQVKWDLISSIVDAFGAKIKNLFRAAGLPKDCLQFRNFGRRPIAVRRYNGVVSPEVARLIECRSHEQTSGLMGNTIELIDRNNKRTCKRFCHQQLDGTLPLLDTYGKSCLVAWAMDTSNSVNISWN